jgi:phosphohistidine phosphatase
MTTRRIWLLRHAKSDWNDASVSDHKRPLNTRGRRSAAQLATTVHREKIAPDLVLVSTARRAMETAEHLDLAVTPEPALYNATAADLLRQLCGLSDDVTSVLLVGHNPGIEDLAVQLGDSDGMSTATLLAFDVEVPTWAELDPKHSKPAGRWEHPGKK